MAVDDETEARPVTLEELAAITAALDAGLPRDVVLAEAGLSIEAWEAAQERWFAKLAADAAAGRLRTGRRYVELLAEQKRRIAEEAQASRAKLEGPMPVAPHAHLSPLQGARPATATAGPRAVAAGDEAARPSPWAAAGTAVPPSPIPVAMTPPPPITAPPPITPPPLITPPPVATTPDAQARPQRAQTLFAMPALVVEPLPFTKDAQRPPPPEAAPAASAELKQTVMGELSPFASGGALPFRPPSEPPRPAPTLIDADTDELPAAVVPRPLAPPGSETRLGEISPNSSSQGAKTTAGEIGPHSSPRGARTAAGEIGPRSSPRGAKTVVGEISPLASRKALPFARSSEPSSGPEPLPANVGAASSPSALPPSPEGSGLPFQRKSPPGKASKTLPFQRPPGLVETGPVVQQPRPADSALPFQQSRQADAALPAQQPGQASSAPPLQQPRQADSALPFQQPERGARVPSSTPPPRPSSAARDTAAGTPQSIEHISLAQYARICASLQAYPGQIPEIQAHYGLDAQRLAALHALWHERFQRDAALMARWQALVDRHKARPGG